MSAFEPERLAAILAHFDGVRRCWIAYSGGLDSTVLLWAAVSVRERLPGALWAVHVDHGLHPDASHWAAHCGFCCETLAVPWVTRELHLTPAPGASVEAVARDARYRVFAELLEPRDLLLTAHHRDDQAETLLLALLRGSGVAGLAAMPRVAVLGRGRLVRPLLDVPRADLEDYARASRLSWLDDPSNAVTALDRNYLRQRVMPLLRARWPALSATVARSAGHCAEAAGLIDRLAETTLDDLAGRRPGTLSIPALGRLDRPLQKAVLRAWFKRRGFAVPDARHLGRILDEILPARPDARPLVAWRGCEVRRYRDDLFAMPPLPEPPSPTLTLAWPVGGADTSLELPQGLGRLHWHPRSRNDLALGQGDTGSGAMDILTVRFGQIGQTCRSGAGGPMRPLKKLFQEAAIPVWLRPYVPLVFQGDTLIAVAGVCACRDVDPAIAMPGAVEWSGSLLDALNSQS